MRPSRDPFWEEDDVSTSGTQQHQHQASYLFLFLLILIVFNPPPVFLVFFFLMMIIISCMRVAQLHRAMGQTEEALRQLPMTVHDINGTRTATRQPPLLRLLRGGQLMVMPGGVGATRFNGERRAAAPEELELLILSQLTQAAQAARSAAAAQEAANQLTDEDLATLPEHAYSKPAAQPQQAQKAQPAAAPQADPQKQTGNADAEAGQTEEPGTSKVDAAGGGGGDDDGLMCSVCLDTVESGDMVMTLPCLHQYHADCVKPWLRQQGRGAVCPMCKTPVFPR